MDEKQARLQESALSDEELDGIVGGAQSVEMVRCAACRRGFASAALYTVGGRKLCPACYRKELKG